MNVRLARFIHKLGSGPLKEAPVLRNFLFSFVLSKCYAKLYEPKVGCVGAVWPVDGFQLVTLYLNIALGIFLS